MIEIPAGHNPSYDNSLAIPIGQTVGVTGFILGTILTKRAVGQACRNAATMLRSARL